MNAPTTQRSYEDRRSEIVAAIPRSYSGAVHFASVVGLALSALAFVSAFVRNVRPLEWSIVPIGFVVANGVEWIVHRGPLHHPTRFGRLLYQRHTLTHHVAFTHEAMSIRSWRELRFVLFPLYALPLFMVLVIPLSLAAWWVVSRNAAALFFATSVGYFLLYEICHTSYHLPAEHPVSRTRIVRWLRRHHQRHHQLDRMLDGNFNVSIPLFDALLGTMLRDRDAT
jgi:hypothetical protein